jgi:hypothetical protein
MRPLGVGDVEFAFGRDTRAKTLHTQEIHELKTEIKELQDLLVGHFYSRDKCTSLYTFV